MTVEELPDWLRQHHSELMQAIKEGSYKPQPVLRVLIPKEEPGKFRPLGIPTAVDRFIQQAVAQELSREYEKVFSDSSHGFRPSRSCHTAIRQAEALANEGYTWAVDLDLAKFFDTVNHSKLLRILSQRIKDGNLISLIHKFLRAPIVENGKVIPSTIGTPQGGPISPVLANIMLNELDQELEQRGHKFVRYADDMMVLCRSKKSVLRTLESIQHFIEEKLFLKLNTEKSKVCRITDPNLKFLGFGFHRQTKDRRIVCVPHQKSKQKCKQCLKLLTSRSNGQSLESFRLKLKQFVVGWCNYFGIGAMRSFVKETDEWLRRRIRQLYWKQWKKIGTKLKALLKLGVTKEKAWIWVNSRKGYWRIAKSWVLSTTLKTNFLRSKGWVCLGDVYK